MSFRHYIEHDKMFYAHSNSWVVAHHETYAYSNANVYELHVC